MSLGKIIAGGVIAVATVGTMNACVENAAEARAAEAAATEPRIVTETEYIDRVEYVEVPTLTPECESMILGAEDVYRAGHDIQQAKVPLMNLLSDIKHAIFADDIPAMSLAQSDLRDIEDGLISGFNEIDSWDAQSDEIVSACYESIGGEDYEQELP